MAVGVLDFWLDFLLSLQPTYLPLDREIVLVSTLRSRLFFATYLLILERERERERVSEGVILLFALYEVKKRVQSMAPIYHLLSSVKRKRCLSNSEV